MANTGAVHPQLVGAAGNGAEQQGALAVAAAQTFVESLRRLAVLKVNMLARAARPVAGQRQVDHALGRGNAAADDGVILLADLASLELLAQAAVAVFISRNQHQAGGGHIEPVYDQGVGVLLLDTAYQAVAIGRVTAGH